MSHKTAQAEELDALQAIYSDELEILNGEYPRISLKITLESELAQSSDDSCIVELQIDLPEKYPDVIPQLSIEGLDENFPADRIAKVLDAMRELARENLGMSMVFTLVSCLQEHVGELLQEKSTEQERAIEMEQERREALERKKFEGSRVTPESFLAWKQKFDKEVNAKREKEVKAREAALGGRLTGRQQFLRDATLCLSDIAIIQDDAANGAVEIDESLFEDDDCLDLDSDNDEEETA